MRILLTVDDRTVAPEFTPELTEEVRESGSVVEEVAQKLRSAGFDAAGVVDMGDTREIILAHTSGWPADLVVVGCHGPHAVKHLLLGSVAESVARRAPCSVEIVRSTAGSA